jgi:hypothetical protein
VKEGLLVVQEPAGERKEEKEILLNKQNVIHDQVSE